MPLTLWRRKDKGTGTYYARGVVAGQTVNKSLGTADARAAKERLEALEAEIRAEVKATAADATKRRFVDIARYYVDQGGDTRFLAPIIKKFGHRVAETITQDEVVAFAREACPKAGAPGRKRQVFTPLNAIFRAAADAELIPMKRFKPPKVKPAPVQYPTDLWIADAVRRFRAPVANMVRVLTYTGLRISEALALKPDDITTGCTHIVTQSASKNGDPVRIALHQEVRLALGLQVQWAKEEGHEEQLWPWADQRAFNKALKAQCEIYNLPVFSSHKLGRHKFAQRLLSSGASTRAVKEAGRWRSQTSMNPYAHLEQTHVDEIVKGTPAIGGNSVEVRSTPLISGNKRAGKSGG